MQLEEGGLGRGQNTQKRLRDMDNMVRKSDWGSSKGEDDREQGGVMFKQTMAGASQNADRHTPEIQGAQ